MLVGGVGLYECLNTAAPTYTLSRLVDFKGGLVIKELRSTLTSLVESKDGFSVKELSLSSR